MMSVPPLPAPEPKTPVGLICGLVCIIAALLVMVVVPQFLGEDNDTAALLTNQLGFVLAGIGALLCFLGRTSKRSERRIGIAAGIFATIGALVAAALVVWQGAQMSIRLFRGAAGDLSVPQKDAVSEAVKAIPNVPDTITFRDVRPFYEAWAEKHLVAAYDAHPSGESVQDEATRGLLRAWMHQRIKAGDALDRAKIEEWQATIEKLPEANAMADFASAAFTPSKAKRVSKLSRAARSLRKTGDAPAARFLAELELWHATQNKRAPKASVPVLEALKKALDQGPISGEDHWVWHHLLLTDSANDFLKANGTAVLAITDATPNLEPWLRHRIRGEHYIKQAWILRGSGWASDVSQNGWRGFETNLASARTELQMSWELNPRHPGAAAAMIAVAMGAADDPGLEMRMWFDRAVTARIDYIQAYHSLRWGLRPRWHGSHKAIEALGRASLQSGRFDTWVPWQYYLSLQEIASEWDEPEAFYPERANWIELEEMFEGYLAAENPPESKERMLTRAAIVADQCKKPAECRAYLERAGFKISAAVAEELGVEAGDWLPRVAAMSGPVASAIRNSQSAERRGDLAAALDGLKAVDPETLDAPSREYLARQIIRIENIRKLQELPWKPLFDDQGMTGWRTVFGSPRLAEPNTLEVDSSLMLVRNAPIGSDFELRGEIELTGPIQNIAGGFALGRLDPDGTEWFNVRLRRTDDNGSSVVFSHRYWDDGFIKRPKIGERSAVHLVVAGGQLNLQVNGTPVLDRQINVRAALGPENEIALFAPLSQPENKVRWRNFQFRTLSQPQP